MTDRLPRSVVEPVNPKLNVSRNANLPHSPGIRIGDYIFLSGMGPVDPPARTACALQLSNGNGIEIECIALGGKSPS
jgi:enamine deaminase RidA (YjgF/YER057c/UK114 family)